MGDFQKDMAFTLARETRPGHVDEVTNYSWDPGGVTKYGIAKSAHPDVDVAHLTLEQAEAIYRTAYWAKAGCDGMQEPLALNVFDAGVNIGVPRAHQLLLAPRLVVPQAADDYLWARIGFYTDLVIRNPAKAVSLAGWIRRCLLVRQASAA